MASQEGGGEGVGVGVTVVTLWVVVGTTDVVVADTVAKKRSKVVI